MKRVIKKVCPQGNIVSEQLCPTHARIVANPVLLLPSITQVVARPPAVGLARRTDHYFTSCVRQDEELTRVIQSFCKHANVATILHQIVENALIDFTDAQDLGKLPSTHNHPSPAPVSRMSNKNARIIQRASPEVILLTQNNHIIRSSSMPNRTIAHTRLERKIMIYYHKDTSYKTGSHTRYSGKQRASAFMSSCSIKDCSSNCFLTLSISSTSISSTCDS